MRPSDALSGHALLEIQTESEHSLANARPVLEVDRDQNEQQPIRSFVFNARFMRSNSPKWKPAFKDHKHDNRCDRCDIAGLIVLEIRQAVQNTTCNYEKMLFNVGQAEQNIFLWNNTLFAVETKTSRTSKYWASLRPFCAACGGLCHEAPTLQIPEKPKQLVPKRGIPWHIIVAIWRAPKFQMMTFVNLFPSCAKDSAAVLAIMDDVLIHLKEAMPALPKVYYRHSALTIIGT